MPKSEYFTDEVVILIQVSTEEGAKDVARFMALFFETFPKFNGRPFHLTGSSFAVRGVKRCLEQILPRRPFLF